MTHRHRVYRPMLACFSSATLALLHPRAAAAGTFTLEQVSRGNAVYAAHCASCHGDALEGRVGPPLRGSEFLDSWGQGTPTVDDLFYVIRISMPKPANGSLTPGEYLDLLAFILSRNGVPACRRAARR